MKPAAAFAALLLCAGLAGEGRCAARPNVILIVVDALRPDHMSLYGGPRPTTPHIDAFARSAAVFSQAISQAPTTLLSFASLYTSLEVAAHGVTTRERALGDGALTLAEIFGIYGYRTAAFTGGHSLHPVFRLNRGFGEYFHVDRTSASFSDTLPPALAWAGARADAGEPFLLVVHGNDLHTPYVFPAQGLYDKGFKVSSELAALKDYEARVFGVHKGRLLLGPGREPLPLTAGDKGHLTARYDEGINYADALVGGFLEGLKTKGLLDGAVVAITADHGEGLFDHDYFFHDFSLYDEVLRVPLVLRAPGVRAARIDRQVRLLDLAPTLLDLAGIAPPEQAQGRSLRPLLEGAAGYDESYSVSQGPFGGAAVRSERWKLILNGGRAELYDLQADPGEKRDLAASEPAKAAELLKELTARRAAGKAHQAEPLPRGAGLPPPAPEEKAWNEDLFRRLLNPGPEGPGAP